MIPADDDGSSAMTVFRPMLEMSLSCSLLDTMLEQRVSTIISTWHSFTFPTRGPRLHGPEIIVIISSRSRSEENLREKIPFDGQILHFSVFVLQEFEEHGHDFPLALLVQFDRVLLELHHQVIGCHKPFICFSKVLISFDVLHHHITQIAWHMSKTHGITMVNTSLAR